MSYFTTTSETTKQLIQLWLHGRSPNTVANYQRHVNSFLAHVDKPIEKVTLMDIQSWQLTLSSVSPASQRNALAVLKSLLTFGFELGVLPVNVGKLARTPKVKERLAEKILTVEFVNRLFVAESNLRNRVMLRLLYSGGLRASELCDLNWGDLKQRDVGGQIRIFGKGGKTRVILLGQGIWDELIKLKGCIATKDDPVFYSQKVNSRGTHHLNRKQVYHIVAEAGKKAGFEEKISPHWLRHSHASHSLDKGAPIHLVQQTLGHSSISVTERYLHAKPDDSSALYLD